MYDISSLVDYYYRARGTGHDRNPVAERVYKALCRAFGVPEEWHTLGLTHRSSHIGEAAHARAVRWENLTGPERLAYQSSYTYWQWRGAVANLVNAVGCFDGAGEKAAIEVEMGVAARALVATVRASTLEMDKHFFAVVFGADTSRTVTEAELIGFGAPTAKELAAMGLDRF
ncbi:MAG TPA: hypothetical protein PKV98_09465 [Burkholderiaceae bacterium]|nr:hypothetical protein [Burkholderiaceae bacterium]